MPVVEDNTPIHFELTQEAPKEVEVPKLNIETPLQQPVQEPVMKYSERETPVVKPITGGILNRPRNIYADEQAVLKQVTPQPVTQDLFSTAVQQPARPEPEQPKIVFKEEPVAEQPKMFLKEEPAEEDAPFTLVMKEEQPVKAEAAFIPPAVGDDTSFNEEDDQRRRATERINKLRNLSFNMNSKESTSEYENVPAYVRRNMELFGNTLTTVEQFYSKYTVKKEENEDAKISSINTFLDGKKPD